MEPGSFPGDYQVASLRKLVTIPDGAGVRGLRNVVVLGRDRNDELVTEARMDFLANRSVTSFEKAEDLIDQAWTPAAPSCASCCRGSPSSTPRRRAAWLWRTPEPGA